MKYTCHFFIPADSQAIGSAIRPLEPLADETPHKPVTSMTYPASPKLPRSTNQQSASFKSTSLLRSATRSHHRIGEKSVSQFLLIMLSLFAKNLLFGIEISTTDDHFEDESVVTSYTRKPTINLDVCASLSSETEMTRFNPVQSPSTNQNSTSSAASVFNPLESIKISKEPLDVPLSAHLACKYLLYYYCCLHLFIIMFSH